MIIRNIWGVGRNYSAHIQEMNSPIPETPLIFLKAGSSATVYSNEITLPWWTEEVHHEVEIALKFSNQLQIMEAAIALDLTERKIQTKAKKEGLPWTLAKSFDGACPVTAFFSLRKLSDLSGKTLKLWVNDELKQEGSADQMIFKPEVLVEYVVAHFPVCAGDLLLTGTPSGVGALKHGDVVKVELQGEITHSWKVSQEAKPVSR